MCCANLGERGITQQRAARSAKRQSHAQRNAFAQRVFFDRCGVSSLTQTRRALTKRWDDGSVVEFYGSPRRICSDARGRCP